MFERPKSGERAVLVRLATGSTDEVEELAEFRELATSAGAEPVSVVTGKCRTPDPKTYIGRGKAEEINELIAAEDVDLVILDHALTPSQERNLERLFQCRVVDRTGLILDIFSQRARSFEGKLQVELAQLRHLSTRLVRGWTHLERQKGGIGLRGPGETQLETDRRLLGQRISTLRQRLDKVVQQRHQGRKARDRALVPTVSVVGYTNAGKSTLFNALTESGVYVADQLFATLDPTLRRLELDGQCVVVLADTVGFIRHLPHDLVAAFRSTLQETRSADLLLHVVDAAGGRRDECIAEVNEVLYEIGAQDIPQIQVFNKIDLLDEGAPEIERSTDGLVSRVWLSARTGVGVNGLRRALAEFFQRENIRRLVRLGPAEGRLRARLFAVGNVLSDQVTEEGGWELEVEFARPEFDRLMRHESALAHRLIP